MSLLKQVAAAVATNAGRCILATIPAVAFWVLAGSRSPVAPVAPVAPDPDLIVAGLAADI